MTKHDMGKLLKFKWNMDNIYNNPTHSIFNYQVNWLITPKQQDMQCNITEWGSARNQTPMFDSRPTCVWPYDWKQLGHTIFSKP
jgi:hypothetical protein